MTVERLLVLTVQSALQVFLFIYFLIVQQYIIENITVTAECITLKRGYR